MLQKTSTVMMGFVVRRDGIILIWSAEKTTNVSEISRTTHVERKKETESQLSEVRDVNNDKENMIKTIVAIATNVSASFDKRGSHSGSYRLRGSDPHPKIWIWRWWPWSCFSYRPTHQPILLERTTDPASSNTMQKGKAGERKREEPWGKLN